MIEHTIGGGFRVASNDIVIEHKLTGRVVTDLDGKVRRFRSEHRAHRWIEREGLTSHNYIVRKEVNE